MTDSKYKFRFGTYGSNSPFKYKGQNIVTQDGYNVYLCPWELKHVDSITMSVQGTTATMGIPNKPSSKTQIFDTSGCVRTFKISGRRYDWEEEISNWDFVNTQYNFAKDQDIGDSPSPDGKFCYIGLNWLLSNMQVLLKGYVFSIINSDQTDNRFIYKNPVITSGMPDQGYNVALIGLSANFSESEPGLLEYTLTVVERFQRGDTFYKPYGPTVIGD